MPECRCGGYAFAVGPDAPGLQVGASVESLKSADAYGVPVRISKGGDVKSRSSKQSKGSKQSGGSGKTGKASRAKNYASLMIAHDVGSVKQHPPAPRRCMRAGILSPSTERAARYRSCYLSLSRWSGEFKFMDRNQPGWNVTAYNRPNQVGNTIGISPSAALAARAALHATGRQEWPHSERSRRAFSRVRWWKFHSQLLCRNRRARSAELSAALVVVQTDRYTRSSPDEIAVYQRMARSRPGNDLPPGKYRWGVRGPGIQFGTPAAVATR